MTNYDAFTRVSDDQDLTVLPLGGVAALSTNSVPIINSSSAPVSVAGRDIGNSADLAFRCHVTAEFDGAVTSLAISVVMSANADLSSGSVLGTATIPLSGLFLGNEFDVRIPALSELNVTGALYLGLLYVPSTPPTTGHLSAWIPLGDSPNRPRRLLANYTGPT